MDKPPLVFDIGRLRPNSQSIVANGLQYISARSINISRKCERFGIFYILFKRLIEYLKRPDQIFFDKSFSGAGADFSIRGVGGSDWIHMVILPFEFLY